MAKRMINQEYNWFWQRGYCDARDGQRSALPDEARRPFQRSDYFAGYEAGCEDRVDDNEFDDDANWAEGTIADGMRAYDRSKP